MLQNDHFPIKRIQSADAKIAVLFKIMDAHRPAVASREKSVNGGILEDNILLTGGMSATQHA